MLLSLSLLLLMASVDGCCCMLGNGIAVVVAAVADVFVCLLAWLFV